MKRVDGMITDNRKRLLHKLHIGQVLKVSLCMKLQIDWMMCVCKSANLTEKFPFALFRWQRRKKPHTQYLVPLCEPIFCSSDSSRQLPRDLRGD